MRRDVLAQGTIAGAYNWPLTNDTLVNAAQLVDQVAGGRRLAGVDVTDDHDVHVNLQSQRRNHQTHARWQKHAQQPLAWQQGIRIRQTSLVFNTCVSSPFPCPWWLALFRRPASSMRVGHVELRPRRWRDKSSMPGIRTRQPRTMQRFAMRGSDCTPPTSTYANAVLRIRLSRRRCPALQIGVKAWSAPSSHLQADSCLLLGVSDVRERRCGATLPLHRSRKLFATQGSVYQVIPRMGIARQSPES
jgi:hypothetical protein